jgi:competence protein ComEC
MKRIIALLAISFLLLTVAGSARSFNHSTSASAITTALQVYALDIGQGDSLLIVSPTGKTVLVDTGDAGNDKRVLEALMSHAGAQRIDLFIASHPHQDHIGVADRVINASTVSTVLDSGFPYTTKTYERYLEAIKQKGAKFVLAEPNQTFDIGGGAVITVLAPIKPYFKKSELRPGATEPNANSVVVRLDYNKFSMIFTGDAEAETEARMIASKSNLKAKVLKVGHHGSKYATSEAFLQAVQPETAVISVGGSNRYGHPTKEALDRLKTAGVKVYRTDLQGEIKITSDGNTYQIATKKETTLEAIFTGRTTKDESESASTAPTESKPTPTAQPTPSVAPAASASGPIIGNKNSKIYHTPGCSSYDKVSEQNRIVFKSVVEAEAAGYKRAKNCSPVETTTPATTAKPEVTPVAKPTPTSPSTTLSTTTSTSAAAPIIGNKNSKIYHKPGCPGYKSVSEKNQVKFNTVAEAEAAGYRLAKNCP